MTPTSETPASVLSQELLDESFACAFEKGWWEDCLDESQGLTEDPMGALAMGATLDPDKVWDRVPEKIALVHSELSEALEDYRVGKMVTVCRADGKPEGFPSELADVVIRVYDLLGALGEDVRNLGDEGEVVALHHSLKTVPAQIAGAHRFASDALAEWHDSTAQDPGFFLDELGGLVSAVAYIANQLGIDMVAEVRQKAIFNRTRPHRHGGKVC